MSETAVYEGVHDTEDRAYWSQVGQDRRAEFIATIGPRVNLPIAPLGNGLEVGGWPAQLRAGRVPYFTAWRYEVNPQWASTYNMRDLSGRDLRVMVLFWLRWDETIRYREGIVYPMHGLWYLWADQIKALAQRRLPIHAYERRQGDAKGNARASAVIDLERYAVRVFCEPEPDKLVRPVRELRRCSDCHMPISVINPDGVCGRCKHERRAQ